MKLSAYVMLCDNIQDFTDAAVRIESEIRRYGVLHDSDDVVPETNSRKHVDMWASIKTVSHFNLGIALELLLKLLLFLSDVDPIPEGHEGHLLVNLHDKLPTELKKRLESTYQGSKRDRAPDGLKMVAYGRDKPGEPESVPNLWTLRKAFNYFDSDALLWQKRYTWEHVNKEVRRHYVFDISAFVTFIRRVMRDIDKQDIPSADQKYLLDTQDL